MPFTTGVRQPRGLVQINGVTMAGWERWSVTSTVYHDPDKAEATFAISALPAGYGVDWWRGQGDLYIEVFDGFPANPDDYSTSDLTTRFYGKVDEVTVTWEDGTLEVNARDLAAQMMDTKSEEKYRNSTASDVANALAAKYGLEPQVTATTTLVGRFYATDHVDLHSDKTEWDLLLWLARQESFICYVQGKTLYFGPAPGSSSPYVVTYTPPSSDYGSPEIDAVSLKVTKVHTIATDLQVTVQSFHAGAKQAYSKIAKRSRTGATRVQKYSYIIPGLRPDEAQDRANQILEEISKHEMRLAMSGPADNVLQRSSVIQLTGTGTADDQLYYPDSIHREMSFEGGYAWTVEAKNHDPQFEPTL